MSNTVYMLSLWCCLTIKHNYDNYYNYVSKETLLRERKRKVFALQVILRIFRWIRARRNRMGFFLFKTLDRESQLRPSRINETNKSPQHPAFFPRGERRIPASHCLLIIGWGHADATFCMAASSARSHNVCFPCPVEISVYPWRLSRTGPPAGTGFSEFWL